MERLTLRDSEGKAHASKIGYFDMIEKLAKYEEAEEQGLLLWLPCKRGEIVYRVLGGGIYEGPVFVATKFDVEDYRYYEAGCLAFSREEAKKMCGEIKEIVKKEKTFEETKGLMEEGLKALNEDIKILQRNMKEIEDILTSASCLEDLKNTGFDIEKGLKHIGLF